MQLTRANGTPHEYCVIPHQGASQCCMSSTVINPSIIQSKNIDYHNID